MKARELRELSPQELRDKLEELRKKLMELNFQRRTAHVEKPHLFREVKREIARILSIIKEKEEKEKQG